MPLKNASQEQMEAVTRLMREKREEQALKKCCKLVKKFPEDINLLGLLASIQAHLSQFNKAEQTLRETIRLAPGFARPYEDLGAMYLRRGQLDKAVTSLEAAIALNPGEVITRLMLAQALAMGGLLDQASRHCEIVLKSQPGNLKALAIRGEVAVQGEKLQEAREIYSELVRRAPEHVPSIVSLAKVLQNLDELEKSIACYRRALELAPSDSGIHLLLAAVLAAASQPSESALAYRRCLENDPQNIQALLGLGHMEKTLGNRQAGIDAYLRAVSEHPDNGAAYYSLSNLKDYYLEDSLIERMESHLKETQELGVSEINMCFALGKAYEDRADYPRAWSYFSQGNSGQRQTRPYDPQRVSAQNKAVKSVFTEGFLQVSRGCINAEATPIFIVGMPRAGSTLLEQILASHSSIEGTSELPFVHRLIRNLRSPLGGPAIYPEVINELQEADFLSLGQDYLASAAVHRQGGHPFFIDKMPNNFTAVGFIHSILPEARIIDITRNPVDVCVANLRHHFSRGQAFAYSQGDVAHYYREYRGLMDHWLSVVPEGQILQLSYEELVTDFEVQVRRILDFLKLGWEQRCLDFHSTKRAIHTASSEQVRQPLFTSSLGFSRHYDAYLDELKGALQA